MKRLLFYALLAVVGIDASLAQQLDNPTKVPLSFKIKGHASDLECEYGDCEFYEISATLAGVTSSVDDDQEGWSSWGNKVTASIEPGRARYIDVDFGSYGDQIKFDFTAPIGHRIYVEDVERSSYTSSSGGSVKIRLLPERAPVSGPVGTMTSFKPGKICWSLSMGYLSNGKPAGYIGLLREDFSASVFTPSELFFDSESDSIVPIYVSGSLRQVKAEQALADITTSGSTAYYIKIYSIDQVGSVSGGVYSVSGSPDITYHITKDGISTRLKITKTVGAKTWQTTLEKTAEDWTILDWHLTGTSALRKIVSDFTSNGLVETRETKNDANVIATKTRYEYQNFAWGKEIVKTIEGYGGSDPMEANYAYYDNASNKGSYGKIKSITRNDGSWIKYEYHEDTARLGRLKEVHEPWLDYPSSLPADSSIEGKVTTYDYDYDWTLEKKTLLSSTETKVRQSSGATQRVTAKTTISNGNDLAYIREYGVAKPLNLYVADHSEWSSSSSAVVSTIKTFKPNNDVFVSDRVYSVRREDWSAVSYAYLKGSFNQSTLAFAVNPSGSDVMAVRITGSWSSSSGGNLMTQYGEHAMKQDIEPIYLKEALSSMTQTITTSNGKNLYVASYIYDGSAFKFTSGQLTKKNDLGQTYEVKNVFASDSSASSYNYATVYSASFVDGQMVSETDAGGRVMQFQYDGMGRAYKITYASESSGYLGLAAQPGVVTEFKFDADSRVLEKLVGTSNKVVEKWDYDTAGRLVSQSAPGNYNSAVIDIQTTYSYDVDGRKGTTVFPGGGTRYEHLYRDGRLQKIEGTAQPPSYYAFSVLADGSTQTEAKPTQSSIFRWRRTANDWLGRITTVTTPTYLYAVDTSATLISKNVYNGRGQLAYSYSYGGQSGNPRQSSNYRYEYGYLGEVVREGLDIDLDGILEPASFDRISDHAVDVVSEGSQLYLKSLTETYGFANSATKTKVSENWARLTGLNATSIRSQVRSYDGNGNLTTTTVAYDRGNNLVTTTIDHPDAANHSYAYVFNGRLARETSTQGETIDYQYDAYGRISKTLGRDSVEETLHYYAQTDQLQKTSNLDHDLGTFYYDSAGRLKSKYVHDGSKWLISRFSYNVDGSLYRQWGSAEQPVEYAYNQYGQRTHMRTYRSGSLWNQSSWPSSPGAADETEWVYQDQTGLLVTKTDAKGHHTRFEYNLRGQVTKEISPRFRSGSNHHEKSLIYYEDEPGVHVSDFTSELKRIEYTGNLQTDLEYRYNRAGLLAEVDDYTGTRSFVYRASDLQLDKEILPTFFGGTTSNPRVLRRRYESSGLPGRYKGLQFGLSTVDPDDPWDPGSLYFTNMNYDSSSGALRFVYGRGTSSGRGFDYRYKTGSSLLSSVEWSNSDEDFTRNFSWSNTENLLDQVNTVYDSGMVAKYESGYDDAGRKTHTKFSGPLAATQGYSHGWQADYVFSDRSELEASTSYSLNSSGAKTSTQLVSRARDYGYDNAMNRDSKQYQNSSSQLTTYATSQTNELASASGHQAGTFSYDEAGNLMRSPTDYCSYDAADRLAKVQHRDEDYRSYFAYDYLGRVVAHFKSSWDSDEGELRTDYARSRRFLWDGWNLIAELDYHGKQPVKTYTWGIDASGTVDGAGGVGGLLMVEEGYSKYYPVYDDNGNVTGLLNNGGSKVAWYDYDPYGELIGSGGSKVEVCPFRFATRYTDSESGLVYYGHRFYEPGLGRFLNRDPIGELGGNNLYAMAGNDPVGHWDYLGLRPQAIPNGRGLKILGLINDEPEEDSWLELQQATDMFWDRGWFGDRRYYVTSSSAGGDSFSFIASDLYGEASSGKAASLRRVKVGEVTVGPLEDEHGNPVGEGSSSDAYVLRWVMTGGESANLDGSNNPLDGVRAFGRQEIGALADSLGKAFDSGQLNVNGQGRGEIKLGDNVTAGLSVSLLNGSVDSSRVITGRVAVNGFIRYKSDPLNSQGDMFVIGTTAGGSPLAFTYDPSSKAFDFTDGSFKASISVGMRRAIATFPLTDAAVYREVGAYGSYQYIFDGRGTEKASWGIYGRVFVDDSYDPNQKARLELRLSIATGTTHPDLF